MKYAVILIINWVARRIIKINDNINFDNSHMFHHNIIPIIV